MEFRPLHDRVVIRRVDPEAKTTGGIIIPDTAEEKVMEGEIVAVGAGARKDADSVVPLDVRPRDRILFSKWSGSEIKLDGKVVRAALQGAVSVAGLPIMTEAMVAEAPPKSGQ